MRPEADDYSTRAINRKRLTQVCRATSSQVRVRLVDTSGRSFRSSALYARCRGWQATYPDRHFASTNGVDRSTRRPEDFSSFSQRSCTSSVVRIVVVSSCMPRRAMKTLVGSLIHANECRDMGVGSSGRAAGPRTATRAVGAVYPR